MFSAEGYSPPSQPRARPPEIPKFGAGTLMLLINVVGLDAMLKRPSACYSLGLDMLAHVLTKISQLPKGQIADSRTLQQGGPG